MFKRKTLLMLVLIVALLFVCLSNIVVGCERNKGKEQFFSESPKFKEMIIERGFQGVINNVVLSSKEDLKKAEPICLISSDGMVENLKLKFNFENKNRYTITQIVLNNVAYTEAQFDKKTTAQTVIIDYKVPKQSLKEFSIVVSNIKYRLPNMQQTVKNNDMVITQIKFLIDPKFKITLQHNGKVLDSFENKYFESLNIPSNLEMSLGEFKIPGQGFAGWFLGDQSFNGNSQCLFNKDVILTAKYEMLVEYKVFDKQDYATVVGFTKTGKETKIIDILDRVTLKDSATDEYKEYIVKAIGKEAFQQDSMPSRQYEIPDTIDVIGERAFYNVKSFIDVGFGDTSVKTIEKQAFMNASNINIGRLPDNLVNIGYQAFAACVWDTTTLKNPSQQILPTMKKTLVIPSSVKKIAANAFEASKFEIINFMANSELDYENIEKNIFLNSNVSKFISGVYFPKYNDGSYHVALSEVPKVGTEELGIEKIGERWFYGCKNLSSLHLANGIKSIGIEAFSGTTNSSLSLLKEINFRDSLEEIEAKAFQNSGLESFLFEQTSNFKYLGELAFQNNVNLTRPIFYSLQKYGRSPFHGCTRIDMIQFDIKNGQKIYYVPHRWITGTGLSRFAKYYFPQEDVEYYRNQNNGWGNSFGKPINIDIAEDEHEHPILALGELAGVVPAGTSGYKVSLEKIENLDNEYKVTNIYTDKYGGVFINNTVIIPDIISSGGVDYNITQIGGSVIASESVRIIKMTSNIKIIEKNAFRNRNIDTIEWLDSGNNVIPPDYIKDISLEIIGEYAFATTKIKTFQTSYKLKYIGKCAFSNCSELTSIKIIYGFIDSDKGKLNVKDNAFNKVGKDAPERKLTIWIDCKYIEEFSSNVFPHIDKVYIKPTEDGEIPIDFGAFYVANDTQKPKLYFSNGQDGWDAFIKKKYPSGSVPSTVCYEYGGSWSGNWEGI